MFSLEVMNLLKINYSINTTREVEALLKREILFFIGKGY